MKANAALVYKASSKGFSSFYSGPNLSYTGAGNLANSQLSNICNTNCSDHGIAVHFSMGKLGALQSASRRLMLGYGDYVRDFNSISVVDQTASISGSTSVTVGFVTN